MAKQVSLNNDAWMEFETRLRGYVGRRVDPSSVDDVVGGILLRLAQNQDGLTASRNPIAWALRVAGNAVADHHRRKAAERRALAEVKENPGPEQIAASDTTPAEDLAACLLPMVRALPESYAEALLLTDIDGLTQTEAAKRLGLSVSGMKSRVQRGRKLLRETLLRCCRVELDHRGGIIDYSRRGTGCGCIKKEKDEP